MVLQMNIYFAIISVNSVFFSIPKGKKVVEILVAYGSRKLLR